MDDKKFNAKRAKKKAWKTKPRSKRDPLTETKKQKIREKAGF